MWFQNIKFNNETKITQSKYITVIYIIFCIKYKSRLKIEVLKKKSNNTENVEASIKIFINIWPLCS